jgi:hypothetical protein
MFCKGRDVQILTQSPEENARSCIPPSWDTTRDSNTEAPYSQAICGRRHSSGGQVGHVAFYELFGTQCEREGMLRAYRETSYRRDFDDAVGQNT